MKKLDILFDKDRKSIGLATMKNPLLSFMACNESSL